MRAVRRGLPLIVVAAFLAAIAAYGVSLLLPKEYEATTSIILGSSATRFTGVDSSSIERQLATTDALLTAPRVLTAAAGEVSGESGDSLATKVESVVDPDRTGANVIEIHVTDEDPEHAAAIANAVAKHFLDERAAFERERIESARAELLEQRDALVSQPGTDAQIARIDERLNQFGLAGAGAGTDLQVLAPAEPPSGPSSPKPTRNAFVAFIVVGFLGTLLVLARDQLAPRVGSPRELAALLRVPILAGIPFVARRGSSQRKRLLGGAEAEAYEALRAHLERLLPPGDRPHTLLVTSAEQGEGKTTVAWRLGTVLARGDKRVLLVSADLRMPKVEQLVQANPRLGLADLLVDAETKGVVDPGKIHKVVVDLGIRAGSAGKGYLHLLGSGRSVDEPGRLMSSDSFGPLIDALRTLDYDYCIFDAPPLLGLVDSQVMWRELDQRLLVARIGQLSIEHVAALDDTFASLDREPLGIVAIGVQTDPSPYYMMARPALTSSEGAISS